MPVSSATLTSRWIVFFSLAIVGCAIDVLSKNWVFGRLGMPAFDGPAIRLVGDYLRLETSLNEGALFGFGQGGGWVFVLLAFCAISGIIAWLSIGKAIHERWLNVALGSVVGGIAGNLYDRLGLPGLKWHVPERAGEPVVAVRDWIHFQIPGVFDWPVFNIADSLLVVGVSFLLWQTFRAEMRPQQAPPEA